MWQPGRAMAAQGNGEESTRSSGARPTETADENKENERRGTAEKGHRAHHGHKETTTAAAQATTSRAHSAHNLPLRTTSQVRTGTRQTRHEWAAAYGAPLVDQLSSEQQQTSASTVTTGLSTPAAAQPSYKPPRAAPLCSAPFPRPLVAQQMETHGRR